METNTENSRRKKQIESALLIFVLVATCIVMVIPSSAPEAKADITHLANTMFEDWTGPPMPPNIYDLDPTPNVVLWDVNDNHTLNDNYIVDPGWTLNIPALNYINGVNPTEHWIKFMGLYTITVMSGGKLTTDTDFNDMTKTPFLSGIFGQWDGIYFMPGSEGCIVDCLVEQSQNGVQFAPDSKLISPGITQSRFINNGNYGVKMDGTKGYTNIHDSVYFNSNSGIGVDVANGFLNITNPPLTSSQFISHGPGLSSLHITNAIVFVDTTYFTNGPQPGNSVYIEDNPTPNSTVLSNCIFMQGAADNYYIRCDGASAFIEDATFTLGGGIYTIIANDNIAGDPAHPILRNPLNLTGDYFDNSTCNATLDSTVTIQWYLDVYVDDPDGNPIIGKPVVVEDVLDNPAEPPSKMTDGFGYARGFAVTELVIHNDSVDNFNPFNVSAENKSMLGYADPEPIINKTRGVTVTVPFNPEPNQSPNVTWITTPVGIQSGDVTIQYKVVDLDKGESGSLYVKVYWSTNGADWNLATQGGGDPLTGLYNDTEYTFIWDSDNGGGGDLQDIYNTTVQLKIVAFDGYGEGFSNETGIFTVDNKGGPIILSGPTATATNTTALIEWTVDEPANATVWWGIDDTLTDETTNNSMTMAQSVTLTNLQPGRRYTYVINSTDLQGFTTSSYPDPGTYVFFTEVHIQLYVGWNMISVLPIVNDDSLDSVLATIAGDWDTVWCYDASDPIDPWKLNDTDNPLGSDLHNINEEMGVWIHMINDAVLILDQTVPDPDPPHTTDILLYPGWNLVGYPSVTTRTVAAAMVDFFGSPITFTELKTYDAATGQWLSYDGGAGALTDMEMGRGYWIYVPDYALWAVSYV